MGTYPSEILNSLCSFFKELLEKMMSEERSAYLEQHPETKGNGYYERKILSFIGELPEIQIPRTRDSNFRSHLLPKNQSDSSLENLISHMFKRGLSTRNIETILTENFGVSLSHTTISKLSTIAFDEVQKWKNRPLAKEYSAIFIDAFFFPLKRDTVANEAIYVALGITPDGFREVLGYWIPGGCEGASNWEEILHNICSRGVQSVDFIVADGLKGISEAISRVFPHAQYQYCVLHACRSSLNKVRSSDKKNLSDSLKRIYLADNKQDAKVALEEFVAKWQSIYPKVTSFWVDKFENLTAFMVLPNKLWRYVYTTNWAERLHKEIKRRIKSMEQFQNEVSAEKILYMLYLEQNKRYQKCGVNMWKALYPKKVESETNVIRKSKIVSMQY